ncbi:MAG TPA: MFS transporter [Thermomicrobiales bacterium]|nr:MFS transporter [Thermomicrobiales bacterium]
MPVYYLLAGGQAFFFSLVFTVNMIYQATVVGLSPLQLVLVGTMMEAACFLFEVPTGIVADVYSRRLSTLLGVGFVGCGIILEGSVPEFWAMLGSSFLMGVGFTFTSGATDAWITDEVGEDAVGPVFLRSGQVWLIGGLAGTLASVGLGVIHIQLPIVLAGVGMMLLAAALALLMPERHMHVTPREERTTFGHMIHTGREGIRVARGRPVARTVILVSLIVGLASEAFDRLHTPSIIARFDFPTVFGTDSPVVWFGLSSVVGTLLGLAASEIFKRKNPEALGVGTPARLLAILTGIEIAGVVVFALAGSLWIAFAMLWLRGVTGTLIGPVQGAWLNRNLDSATRATVLSMTGQANAIGQVVGGPALGWVGSAVSVRAALLGSALVLTPILALYARMIPRDRGIADLVEEAPEEEPLLA